MTDGWHRNFMRKAERRAIRKHRLRARKAKLEADKASRDLERLLKSECDLGPELEAEPKVDRICLKCTRRFVASGVYNRICVPCRKYISRIYGATP